MSRAESSCYFYVERAELNHSGGRYQFSKYLKEFLNTLRRPLWACDLFPNGFDIPLQKPASSLLLYKSPVGHHPVWAGFCCYTFSVSFSCWSLSCVIRRLTFPFPFPVYHTTSDGKRKVRRKYRFLFPVGLFPMLSGALPSRFPFLLVPTLLQMRKESRRKARFV